MKDCAICNRTIGAICIECFVEIYKTRIVRDKYALVYISEIGLWCTPKWDRTPAITPFDTVRRRESWPYIVLESKDWKNVKRIPRCLSINMYYKIAIEMFENLTDKEIEMKFLALKIKGK